MDVITTKRGAPALLVEGFRFIKDRARGDTVYWKCGETGCKSRCSTCKDFITLLSQPSYHNHSKPDLDMEKVRHTCRKRALESMNCSAGKVVCEEAVKFPRLSYQNLKALKNSVYRCRLKQRPPLPKTREEALKAFTSITSEVIDVIRIDEMQKLDRAFSERLVMQVKSHPCLYDPSLPEYKDKYHMEAVWNEVAEQLDSSADEIRRRWNNLRESYSKHLGFKPPPSGSGERTSGYRSFFLCKQMEFLRPFMANCSVSELEHHCPAESQGPLIKHEPEDESPTGMSSPRVSPSIHLSVSNSPQPAATSPSPDHTELSPQPTSSMQIIPHSSALWDAQFSENEMTTRQVAHPSTSSKKKRKTDSYDADLDLAMVNHMDPDLTWFLGLLPYVRALTKRKKRQFVTETTTLLMKLVDESEEEFGMGY